ncbi:FemAB-related protein (PEP-CTERM system-associated) [Novosphingobium kunmingense]|uniref:FemAB-related protein (PEP-CTERM system-associated) n=1 Tax=Novosphingobium kunmingense TaxID=1211806 RepID=A0A2N0I335_9SPHN|nr:FemAB family XrtA/PEP-CTERM system-associated protein [Novosphingobium kunmingense]PKB25593.1 FemAB-related protein (PEP-CTERM system-associated) [Novosphingobium kunmingense]
MNAPFRPQTATVRPVDLGLSLEQARIEGFVAVQPDGTAFHRPAWLGAVARGTGNRALALIAERDDELCGYLPLIDVRSPLFGRALVSSGFAIGGGILASDRAVADTILAAAEAFALAQGATSLELRGGVLPAARAGWSVRGDAHSGFVRGLADDDEAQLAAIPRKQRAEVRKGLTEDLVVTVGRDWADRRAHYAVYAESVRNLGTPVFPRRLFAEVLDAFGGDADVLTVWHRTTPIASVLSLYHQGAVMPYWGGGTPAARSLRANDRMYYELMLHARRRGCDRFDFGRSKTGSGAHAFKRNWGFEAEPLRYATWTAPGTRGRNIDPTSDSHNASIALWKRMPLGIANLVGPWIARGLG